MRFFPFLSLPGRRFIDEFEALIGLNAIWILTDFGSEFEELTVLQEVCAVSLFHAFDQVLECWTLFEHVDDALWRQD